MGEFPHLDTIRPTKKLVIDQLVTARGSMGDDLFSGQNYLPTRIPETPLFDETSSSRIIEASGSTRTPSKGRGMSYVRKK